jgi:hypothetical protein
MYLGEARGVLYRPVMNENSTPRTWWSGTRLLMFFMMLVILVASGYAYVSTHRRTAVQVIDLPDPPEYQESLPNPPSSDQAPRR